MPDTLVSAETLSSLHRSSPPPEMCLRRLWESYRQAWRALSKAMDEQDAAMLARPDIAERGSTEAEKTASSRRARADTAFAAATDALATAPARTADDAICKLLFVIDRANLGDEEERAIRAAIRILKKKS